MTNCNDVVIIKHDAIELGQTKTHKDGTSLEWLILYLLLLLLSSSSSSSVSPLCRVFTLTFLRQTMSLGNTVLQLF
jgi:hypothetical protein